MPLVSVVIPSYNHEKYLAQAVGSVLAQTLTDLELIVVDDGSSDGSLQLLSQFSDPRLRIFTQSNQGAHAAINRGLALSSGFYLTILNSDDAYHPQRLEKLVEVFHNTPKTGLAGSYIQVIDGQGAPLGIKKGYHTLEPWPLPKPELSLRAGEDLRMVLLTENYWATSSNFFFTRPIYEQGGPLQPLRYTHDWDFALRIAALAPFVLIPEPLLSYRVHPGNTIRENQVAMIFEICWIIAVHLPAAARSAWFQSKEADLRAAQLFHSLHVFGCERVLALLLIQDLAGHPEQALRLLDSDNPTLQMYLGYIRDQLGNPSPNALPVNERGFRSRLHKLAASVKKRL